MDKTAFSPIARMIRRIKNEKDAEMIKTSPRNLKGYMEKKNMTKKAAGELLKQKRIGGKPDLITPELSTSSNRKISEGVDENPMITQQVQPEEPMNTQKYQNKTAGATWDALKNVDLDKLIGGTAAMIPKTLEGAKSAIKGAIPSSLEEAGKYTGQLGNNFRDLLSGLQSQGAAGDPMSKKLIEIMTSNAAKNVGKGAAIPAGAMALLLGGHQLGKMRYRNQAPQMPEQKPDQEKTGMDKQAWPSWQGVKDTAGTVGYAAKEGIKELYNKGSKSPGIMGSIMQAPQNTINAVKSAPGAFFDAIGGNSGNNYSALAKFMDTAPGAAKGLAATAGGLGAGYGAYRLAKGGYNKLFGQKPQQGQVKTSSLNNQISRGFFEGFMIKMAATLPELFQQIKSQPAGAVRDTVTGMARKQFGNMPALSQANLFSRLRQALPSARSAVDTTFSQ